MRLIILILYYLYMQVLIPIWCKCAYTDYSKLHLTNELGQLQQQKAPQFRHIQQQQELQ